MLINLNQKLKYLLSVLLIISVILACEEESPSASLVDSGALAAGFDTTVDPNEPLSVTFSNTSTGALSYQWDFGDGNGTAVKDATHSYENNGTYNVVLVVAKRGGSEIDSTSQTITVSLPAEASFNPVVDGTTVQFSDQSENAVGWNWDFGDGNTSTEQNPSHTYSMGGYYMVSLTVTDLLGVTSLSEQTLGVGPVPNANFDFTSSKSVVSFTNTSTNGESFLWDFGDGNTSTEENPEYTFSRLGDYTVTLTTTNSLGTNSSEQVVSISDIDISIALSNETGKTWTLAEIAGPIKVGPAPGSGEWWPGPSLEDVQGGRACQQDDAFTFLNDGSFSYNSQGSTFIDGSYLPGDDGTCQDPATFPAPFDGLADNDAYTFSVVDATDTDPAYITVNGEGAFIGFSKAHNGGEYTTDATALVSTITYSVVEISLVEGKERMVISVDYCGGGCFWTMTIETEN